MKKCIICGVELIGDLNRLKRTCCGKAECIRERGRRVNRDQRARRLQGIAGTRLLPHGPKNCKFCGASLAGRYYTTVQCGKKECQLAYHAEKKREYRNPKKQKGLKRHVRHRTGEQVP